MPRQKIAIEGTGLFAEFDSSTNSAWIHRDQESEEPKYSMKFREGRWKPTQAAFLLADQTDPIAEVDAVLDWLQQTHPQGSPSPE